MKHINIFKITVSALIILIAAGCGKNQNSFLPNTQVNISLTPYEFSFIDISGNSIVFQGYGYNGNGIILSCANPDPSSPQFYAYDATCPNEKDYSGVVTVTPVKNYTTPPYRIFSSSFFGTCNKCGSVFNLMGGGNPTSGPATHYLQNYNVLTGNQSITITN